MARTVSRNSLYENAARSSYQNPANSGSRMPVPKFANGGRTDIAMPVGPAGPINSRPISPPREQRTPDQRAAFRARRNAMMPPPPPGIAPSIAGPGGMPPSQYSGQMTIYGAPSVSNMIPQPQVPKPMPYQAGVMPQPSPYQMGVMPKPAPFQQTGQPMGQMIGMPNPMTTGMPSPMPAMGNPMPAMGNPMVSPGFSAGRVPMAPMLQNPWR